MSIAALFSVLVATCFIYAFLMGIVKKEPSYHWQQRTALLTTLSVMLAVAFSYQYVFENSSFHYFITAILLLFALGNAFGLVVLQKKLRPLPGAVYSASLQKTARTLAIIIFSTLCVALLTFVAGLAG